MTCQHSPSYYSHDPATAPPYDAAPLPRHYYRHENPHPVATAAGAVLGGALGLRLLARAAAWPHYYSRHWARHWQHGAFRPRLGFAALVGLAMGAWFGAHAGRALATRADARRHEYGYPYGFGDAELRYAYEEQRLLHGDSMRRAYPPPPPPQPQQQPQTPPYPYPAPRAGPSSGPAA